MKIASVGGEDSQRAIRKPTGLALPIIGPLDPPCFPFPQKQRQPVTSVLPSPVQGLAQRFPTPGSRLQRLLGKGLGTARLAASPSRQQRKATFKIRCHGTSLPLTNQRKTRRAEELKGYDIKSFCRFFLWGPWGFRSWRRAWKRRFYVFSR